MRSFSYILFLFGLALFAPYSNAGDFKLEPGFKLIFNGKDLDGWRQKSDKAALASKTHAYDGRFKVDGGVLLFDPTVKGVRSIETTKEFDKDVHFKLDFKPGPKCKNCILFREIKGFDIVPGQGETKAVKEGEWHSFEARATGETLQYSINGEVARTAIKIKAKSSSLVLRAETGKMEIKNIRVKE